MTFFVRNIALLFLLAALIGVGLASSLSGRTLYGLMVTRVAHEKVALVESLGSLGFSTENVDVSVFAQTFSDPTIIGNGVESLRLVDTSNRRILLSSNLDEVGRAVERDLPKTFSDKVRVSVVLVENREVVDIAYLGRGVVIWMTLEPSFFSSPAVLFAVQNAFILLLLIGFLALLFYLIARRYFVRPLQLLQKSLSDKIADGELKKSDDFGRLLESFATVAEKIDETLARDRLISQMKSDFISTTAHQLRTPLSGINWALGALLSGGANLSTEQKSLVERALEKNKELIDLVGTLLNAASIEEGKFGYRREPISIKEEVSRVVEEERPNASRAKATISLAIPEGSVPEVLADRERIRWILRNLIENAVRYSPEGSEIVVSLTQDPKQVQVSVKDLGMGISDKDRPYIFQKFFRADRAQKLRNDGSGLGLFIAKNIVSYHGGRIWFESEEGKGSTFYFSLPVFHRGEGGVA